LPIPKKSVTGKQPPAEVHPRVSPPSPTANTSPLLKGFKAVRAGPGTTRINLTRQEVEERLSNYRKEQQATNQESLWRRLTNVFGKSRKGE